jgi:septal ring factor EnvC (AmiA/AmiB activator)
MMTNTLGVVGGVAPSNPPPNFDYAHLMPFFEMIQAPDDYKKKYDVLTAFSNQIKERYNVLLKLEKVLAEKLKSAAKKLLESEHILKQADTQTKSFEKREKQIVHDRELLDDKIMSLDTSMKAIEQREVAATKREKDIEAARAHLKKVMIEG